MDSSLVAEKENISNDGFTVINDVYNADEVKAILDAIAAADQSNPAFRKTDDLFAIRQFLKELPQVVPLIFNSKLKALINILFGGSYFVTKSIYFDKPELSNWFVAWHQDLTIVVDKKAEIAGYGPWTIKQNQFGVQPPLPILQSNFTIRIHLDDTNGNNGALKVIPGSHNKGVYRPETINWDKETEAACNVNGGGVMIMRPLLLHASNRTTNGQRRRVVHIEFSNVELGGGLRWGEKAVI
ncbi:phytanoyl-CoA dioxygenase family protein [Mucilaginibacter sp. FT3.2]|uniref:phytanoyl-CoA dioxygenase family protein n=1 Tax=Mucilaginibacter sp. FT3.2 TaxID=2723090 RepID=UPI001613992E|nr:phytanoyl-CoA dioxygenase family protein [Mucilaginibacter sp. FT3.2]MBB6233164.1 ectoine hydroxylase-related dioxygenase (phytanoyl-CoA dioxygenase family) [Mucilaginibacter sp. FT3.2]